MKNANPIRILVAEDHLVARVGVSTIVNLQPDMTVVAEAANGQQAIELYAAVVVDPARAVAIDPNLAPDWDEHMARRPAAPQTGARGAARPERVAPCRASFAPRRRSMPLEQELATFDRELPRLLRLGFGSSGGRCER